MAHFTVTIHDLSPQDLPLLADLLGNLRNPAQPAMHPTPAAALSKGALAIYTSMAKRVLTPSQRVVLRCWLASKTEPVSTAAVAAKLLADGIATSNMEAEAFVVGAVTAFGRRLKPDDYEKASSPMPLRLLVDISNVQGMAHHRLTEDGRAAVEMLLEEASDD